MSEEKLSPMMKQYKEIKEQYQDAILMFRLGDFYEMFFDDALLASKELELTLTGRNCGLEEKAPMCGVPHHAVDSYITKLVKNGHKVAICEQMQDPAEVKGIVDRDIVRIYTPGTIDILESNDSNNNIYIASLYLENDVSALTFADISTGEIVSTEFKDDYNYDSLINELAVYNPSEIILQEKNESIIKEKLSNLMTNIYIENLDESYFSMKNCSDIIQKQFDATSLVSIGLEDKEEIVKTIGSLLMYIFDNQKQEPSQFKNFTIKNNSDSMQLDKSTIRNLELLETLYEHDIHGSLYGILNKTRTAMGARLLKSFLREPLINSHEINKRLDAVDELKNNALVTNNITNSLKNIYDFQRLTTKIATNHVNGRDMIALKTTLSELPEIINNLEYLKSDLINDIKENISDFSDIRNLIEKSICEEPPYTVKEGGIIKSGYSEELDTLKDSIKDAKEWISNLEQSEKERTGIKTLKVGFNKVFGYYIDVSKGMIDKVPEDYIRKQTLVNNERYITPELKEKENMVFSAEGKINKLEYEIFKSVRDSIEPYIDVLQNSSKYIALLDVLVSFSKVSNDNSYVKPVVDDSNILDIKSGRHPTVEKIIGSGMFISNDVLIDSEKKSLLIITGPNMSGKSTYMRQTAVITIMAQIGCFVPAEDAHIGVVDRVFTRIGASDNLAYGQSTFYIEMSELSNIIRNSTSKSLIILDEIGRGTSTFDGLSIAWATTEFLSKPDKKTRTMFATHYHELTELADKYDNIENLSVAVSEKDNNIVFLHNIVKGPASKSYGIHVAKIAGIPTEILTNANDKLISLENVDKNDCQQNENYQLSFNSEFSHDNNENFKEFVKHITNIDVNNITPISAITKLNEIVAKARELKDD